MTPIGSDQPRSGSVTTTATVDTKGSKKTGNNTNMSDDTIIDMFEHFGIDISLSHAISGVDSKIGLIEKYARWVAANKAITIHANETSAKTWEFPTMSKNDLIDHIIAKTTFHNVAKSFTSVTNNPSYANMVEWLKSKGTSKSALEIWGIEKATYNEDDLENWMMKGGSLKKGGSSSKKKKKVHTK